MKEIISLLATIFFANGILYANTYYVSATGNNTHAGTISAPWKTIQHAADVMTAGDSTFIRGGVYNEQVFTQAAGDAANGHISFVAYPNETAVLDGTGISTGSGGFNINHDYIRLDGLEIRNWEDLSCVAIWVIGNTGAHRVGYVQIKNCHIHHVNAGISFTDEVHHFLVSHCRVHDYGPTFTADGSYGFDASSDVIGAHDGVIEFCSAHHQRAEGNHDGFAIGHSAIRNIDMNYDTAYNVFDGFDISGKNNKLNSCIAYECYNGCYKLWTDSITLTNCVGYKAVNSNVELDYGGYSWASPKKVKLINCTFFGSRGDNIWIENPAMDTLDMRNCIVGGADVVGIRFNSDAFENYRGDYNLFHNNNTGRMFGNNLADEDINALPAGTWYASTGQDGHSIVQYDMDSTFMDTGAGNFHLKITAAAIDKGTATGAPSRDCDNAARPVGAGYDIGAYEYGGKPLPPDTGVSIKIYLPGEIKIYPNPASEFIEIDIPDKQIHELKVSFYDIKGQCSAAHVLSPVIRSRFRCPVGNLNTGIYVCHVSGTGFTARQKVAIVK